jgi:hypothetical protein
MDALRELYVRLVTDADTKGLDQFQKKIEGAVSVVEGFGKMLAAGVAALGVTNFIGGMIEAGSAVNDLSERLGVSGEDLQKFQLAGKLAGVSAEETAQAFKLLSKNIGEAIGGGEPAKVFQELGIQLKDAGGHVRDSSDVMLDLADAFEKMDSPAERSAAAFKVFGRAGSAMIPILKGGRGELAATFKQFQELGGGLQKDFIEKADRAGDQLDLMKFGLTSLKSRIAIEALPYVEKFAKVMQEWEVKALKALRTTNLGKVAIGGMAALAGGAGVVALSNFAKAMNLGGGAGGLLKLGLIGLALAAVVVIVDELITLWQGGDTVIGAVIDDLWGVGTAAAVVQTVKDQVEALSGAFDGLGPIVSTIGKLLLIAVGGSIAIGEIVGAVYLAVKAFGAWVQIMSKLAWYVGDITQRLGELAQKAGQFLGSETIAKLGSKLVDAGGSIQVAGAKVEASVTKGGLTGTHGASFEKLESKVDKIEINVNGAATNEGTGRAVAAATKQALNDPLRDALNAIPGPAN